MDATAALASATGHEGMPADSAIGWLRSAGPFRPECRARTGRARSRMEDARARLVWGRALHSQGSSLSLYRRVATRTFFCSPHPRIHAPTTSWWCGAQAPSRCSLASPHCRRVPCAVSCQPANLRSRLTWPARQLQFARILRLLARLPAATLACVAATPLASSHQRLLLLCTLCLRITCSHRADIFSVRLGRHAPSGYCDTIYERRRAISREARTAFTALRCL